MRLVTRAELGRHLGVSTVAVTIACRERIKDACVVNRVDLDHPLVQKWLAERGRAPTKPAVDEPQPAPNEPSPRPRAAVDGPPAQPHGIEDVHGFEDYTLREIVARWGTMSVHSDWLDMRRKQTQIREREIKNHELEGKLIPREAVRTHVFGAIDQVFRRLLQDFPKTMARQVYAMAKAGEPVEKAEDLARDRLSSQLKPVKEHAARVLRAGGAAVVPPRAGSTE